MTGDYDSGRVTNAILSTKLDYLIQKVEEINGAMDRIDHRVDGTERQLERLDERWAAHKAEHQRERGLLAVISTVESVIAGLAAAFLGKS